MGKYSDLSGWLQSAFFLKQLILFTTIRATIVAFRPQRVNQSHVAYITPYHATGYLYP